MWIYRITVVGADIKLERVTPGSQVATQLTSLVTDNAANRAILRQIGISIGLAAGHIAAPANMAADSWS